MTNSDSTTFSIYRIFCTVTQQSYVGQTSRPTHRWVQHRGRLKNGTHHSYKLQAAYTEYGIDAFKYEILESNISADNVDNREAFWMKEYKGYGHGFNVQYVGHENDKPAEVVPFGKRKLDSRYVPMITSTPPSRFGMPTPQPNAPDADAIAKRVANSSEVTEVVKQVKEVFVELRTRRDVAEEELAKVRAENERLVRENAILRWRLGERDGENIRIA